MNPAGSTAALSAQGSLPGLTDILESFRRVSLWTTLGWHDFTIRYRGTLLGPLWQTLTTGVWVAGLGIIFGQVLGRTGDNYLAYLAIGLILWDFMSGMVSDSPAIFAKNSKLIFFVNNPLFTYVLRDITEGMSRLMFEAVVFLAVLPFVKITYSLDMLMAIPGMIAILFTALWVVPLIGILGARFPDLAFVLRTAMRFMFFATPVFWRADGLNERAYLATWNPFAHFIEIVRAPLIGEPVHPHSWTIVLTLSAAGGVITLYLYNRFRKRLVFWL